MHEDEKPDRADKRIVAHSRDRAIIESQAEFPNAEAADVLDYQDITTPKDRPNQ